MKLILASGSPRRRELLDEYGYEFQIRTAPFDEHTVPLTDPEKGVQELALGKARAARDANPQDSNALVLGADTIVVRNGLVLGKPASGEEAVTMLQELSGQTHQVYTGVALVTADTEEVFVSVTDVVFYPLTEEEIRDYVSTGEPMDKAGAYGIQGLGSALVREIHGDYYTVVGLPIAETARRLRNYGILPGSFTKSSIEY